MPATLKFIPMQPVLKGGIKIWGAQKGAQLKDTFGRGCAWYAAQSNDYKRYHSGLFTS
ncbi:hypothetical protein XNC1_4480 [Xenorhabdus nematophila ATCC 19061]|uniref:Uncharacterized protein n=1 Tax=Xenorhabdus nematophila (strain ATCC 19061 / DSM 3370 / CCUG 14189 / LMG 1036 / NCIMB 9965 / AN6) TaxID=406817 RepID=D3VF45_XENNA|nr:hypothetical protein XNC1_4480 [Xenorhabdus nematophila ATCC 19061]